MNVEIGAEAALFPEKEYINGIFVAVWQTAVSIFLVMFCTETMRYFMRVLYTWKIYTMNRIRYFCLDEAIGDLRFAITLHGNCGFLVCWPSFLGLKWSRTNLCWINRWKRRVFRLFWDRGGFPFSCSVANRYHKNMPICVSGPEVICRFSIYRLIVTFCGFTVT